MPKRKITKEIKMLFPRFKDYKSKFLNPNTIDIYDDYLAIINRFPDYLDTAADIRDWLLDRYAAETSRRCLQYMEACYTWAVSSELAKHNPFTKLPDIPKSAYNRREVFSITDRDHIIATFKQQDPYWETFIWFLFKTGCRFEEAVALQVKHIQDNCKIIKIQQAIAASGRITPAKTMLNRKFPCNEPMRQRLQVITAGKPGDDWLFPTFTGTRISGSNFLYRHWKPLVSNSLAQGRIEQCLPVSHTRHTFITLASANGMKVQELAKIVGNSPKTIWEHYAAASDIRVPEF
jgi:integrase